MPTYIKCLRALILLFAFAMTSVGQDASSVDNTKRTIEVTLESRKNNKWQPVDARTVFQPNDEIRFRFRTSFSGYLYVLDRTSSGKDVWLISPAKSGESTQV